jgi:hypothetical protein
MLARHSVRIVGWGGPGLGTALAEQEGGQFLDPLVGGQVEYGTALPLLCDQSAGGEKSQVVGQGGRRQAHAFLNLSDRKAIRAGTNECHQYFKSWLRPNRREPLGRFFQSKHHIAS